MTMDTGDTGGGQSGRASLKYFKSQLRLTNEEKGIGEHTLEKASHAK